MKQAVRHQHGKWAKGLWLAAAMGCCASSWCQPAGEKFTGTGSAAMAKAQEAMVARKADLENPAKALRSEGSLGKIVFVGKAVKGSSGLTLQIKNGSSEELVEAQAEISALGAMGEVLRVAKVQWRGKLAPGAMALAGDFAVSFAGFPEPALGAVSVKVEPMHARFASGKGEGAPASWSLEGKDVKALSEALAQGAAEDAKRALAFGKRGTKPGVSASAIMWGRSGENPYDPTSLRVGFGWSNDTDKAVEVAGSIAKFYKAAGKGTEPMADATLVSPRKLEPGSKSFAWVVYGWPGAGEKAKAGFEASAKSHGVEVLRVYGPVADK